ncbi:MAG TPA: hypothetical protein VGI61_02080 [Parafilimonas sp.]
MKIISAATGLILFSFLSSICNAQYRTNAQNLVLTNEDSLNANSNKSKTVISGYGSAFYQRDFDQQQSIATLERAVLFVGHRFNEKISFFSELEIENAKVAEGENGSGEISMEQAYLKFNLTSNQYLVAGLFVPRIGIINENHLPVNFNGVERPLVETLIIPATWRELGIGFYGSLNNLPLNYDVAIMNGLNSANFEHGSGIREGRAEGSDAFANNLAITAAVQYSISNFKFQISGYAGGTVGLNQRSADSLGLDNGAFGTPVYLGEADVQFAKNGFSTKALATYIAYPDADKINVAYAKNIGSGMYGAYAEVGYDWLYHKQKTAQFITFVRGEMLDLNSSLPAEPKGIYDGTEKQAHIIAGFSYLPIPNVVIKADVRIQHTGPQNPELVINPAPNALPYKQTNQFLNVGIGYSF